MNSGKEQKKYSFPFLLKAVLLSILLYTAFVKEQKVLKTVAKGIITKTDVSLLMNPFAHR